MALLDCLFSKQTIRFSFTRPGSLTYATADTIVLRSGYPRIMNQFAGHTIMEAVFTAFGTPDNELCASAGVTTSRRKRHASGRYNAAKITP